MTPYLCFRSKMKRHAYRITEWLHLKLCQYLSYQKETFESVLNRIHSQHVSFLDNLKLLNCQTNFVIFKICVHKEK